MNLRLQAGGDATVSRIGRVRRYAAWLTLLLALAVGATVVAPAHRAQAITTSQYGWDQVNILKDGTPEFAVGGLSEDFPYARDLFNAYNSELNSVNSVVQSYANQINQVIMSQGSAVDAHLVSLGATAVSDHLSLSFTGDGTGNVTVNFTLPTIQVYMKVNAILETSGTLVVNIGPVTGSATYNDVTGVVSNINVTTGPLNVVSATADSGPYLGTIISTILSGVTGIPLPGAGFVFTAGLNSIATSFLKSAVQGSVFDFTHKPITTNWGVDTLINQIPSTYAIAGTKIAQYLTDAVNANLKGQLVSVAIGGTETGAMIGAPWFNNVQSPGLTTGTHSGQNILTIQVGDIELQVVHEADQPDSTSVNALKAWQECQLGLISAADCTLAKNAGAAIITMDQQIIQYQQSEASLQAEINALVAQYGGNPPLGAPYQLMEELQAALYQLQQLVAGIYGTLGPAQVCLADASAPSASCVSLYG